ncbi:protein kinase domain-containing protein [Pseudooceanicola batsensis]|nr:protein kinase [Pseudooceanicola batsensis]
MALTPKMIAWLEKYTSYQDVGRMKKKGLSKAMEKFWRRKEKVEAAIDALPADSDGKAGLVQRLKAVTDPLESQTDAKSSDLKAAYKALNQIKKDARDTRDQERSDLDPTELQTKLQGLQRELQRVVDYSAGIMPRVRVGHDGPVNGIARLPVLAAEPDFESALEQYTLLSNTIAQYEKEMDAADQRARSEIPTLKGSYISPVGSKKDVETILANAERNIAIIKEDNPATNTGPVDTLIAQIRGFFANDDPLNPQPIQSQIETIIKDKREDFLGRKRAILDLSSFQQRENGPAVNSKGEVGVSEQGNRAEFPHLIKLEEERIERAKEEMRQALMRDRDEISADSEGWRAGDDYGPGDTGDTFRAPPKFDVGGMCAGLDELPYEHAPDRERQAFVAHAASVFNDELDDLIEDDPYGDEMLDLATKSLDEWEKDYMTGMGLRGSKEDLPPKTKQVVEALAKNANNRVMDQFPNKATADYATITLNGETYTKGREFGSGGGGRVFTFRGPNGEEIVLKTPLEGNEEDPGTKKEFADEARNHNQATGGRNGDGHPNLVDMKGVVMSPDGVPLVAMEYAQGGNLNKQNGVNRALAETGAISQEAHQAMIKENLREVVMALKTMEDHHMTHFDLKDLNVFMSEDGHVKLGDFGLAQSMSQRGGKVDNPGQGTPGYQSPELISGEEMSSKSDVYSLTTLLDQLGDPYRGMARHNDRKMASEVEVQTKDDSGEAVEQTAFERLRNAMLEEDPDKRPAMEAILLSSFLEDTKSYDKADLEELRAASTAYSNAVGSEVAQIQEEINFAEGEIRRLERERDGGAATEIVRLNERRILAAEAKVKKYDSRLPELTPGSQLHTEITNYRKWEVADIAKYNDAIDDAKKGIAPVSEVRRAEINKTIEAKRQQVIDYNKALRDINSRPAIAPLLERLKKANAPFGG